MDSISVIIPCYNEAQAIQKTLVIAMESTRLESLPRIFVVDAGSSTDATREAVAKVADRYPGRITYTCLERPSRGRQLICGAKMATTSDYLLFLHADTLLPLGWDAAILQLFKVQKDTVPLLGCFQLALPRPLTISLRIMLWTANFRAQIGKLPYGDQAYFVRRDEYERIGGFADIPLMEDVDLLQRYKQHHNAAQKRKLATRRRSAHCIQVLPLAVTTSPRRWKRKGVWWNTICNQFYMLAWMAGVSPSTIYRWYYGHAVLS
jgi:rSAM/selenodomain-associated transferase 2